MSIPQLAPDVLKLLGQYDTPTICNVIELFEVRPRNTGYMDDRIRACFPEIPGPPIVVFQDLDDPPVAATFGEIMCATYQAFGAAGLITSGAARDLDQVRRLGFPAFSNGAICSHGYSHIPSTHVPVRVGGLAVSPGDLLHADANGVTNIPHDIAADVAAACADYVAAEGIILNFLKTGSQDVRQYSEARQEAMRQIGELGKRVRARRTAA